MSSAGKHDRSPFVEVTIEDTDGRRGYGECATMALWSGETAEAGVSMIEQLFAPALISRSFAHPREAVAVLDRLCYGAPFTKSGLDTAMWDLYAKAQNRRIADLIADRKVVETIPTRSSVGCYDVPNTVRIAREFWNAGVRTLKFKTGVAQFDDVARLKAVRDELGSAPVFTIDANGGYPSEDAAVRAIEALLPFNLALVEQPTPRERISMLARVRKRIAPVPILIDEGVFSPAQLDEAIALDAFDLLSIYPGKNGGFTHSLEMANTAAKAGKYCAIGSNLETDLGQAAMATLAGALSAFPVQRLACDLPGAMYYGQSSTTPALTFRDGCVELPRGVGFGVEPRR
ncbi:MAG: hypothetical protein IT444_04260 [Phycisphaeraceae bacterium]|nr:hypothetical protein [Phycisphaeraceae bacterium]